jgi:RNA polymerase sigma-70 factor (ECF subfamily)
MTGPPTDQAADLARHRDHLVRIAYRLLGSVDEAEDVVQDVLARAGAAAPDDLREPVAWLTRVVTNAALDRLRSARVRREAYVGTWLRSPRSAHRGSPIPAVAIPGSATPASG